jgi:hypothetical protein
MIIPGTEDMLHDGEVNRAIVRRIELVGPDAVVDFEDLDRPGLSFVAAVTGEEVPECGVVVGDECLARYRLGQGVSRPARWQVVMWLAKPVPAGSEASHV